MEVRSSKDLSNVVLVFAEEALQRFEGLHRHAGTFAGTGAHEGREIARVYVKSGANHSGGGPGYGERFDRDRPCAPTVPAPTPVWPPRAGRGTTSPES